MQIAAEEALEGRPGAIVAMDPRNGEILAMVSRPAFDPNEFAVRITREEWNRLVTDPGKPLLNKAIQAQLAPGSVFKVIMATAGLQEGIAQDLVITCGGGKTFLRALLQVLDRWTRQSRDASASAKRSSSLAIRTSTPWPRSWASAASPNTPPCSGWDRRLALICRRKSPA